MDKMVRNIYRLPFFLMGHHIVPSKKNGQLMTHHNGLIPPIARDICTRIEECRHIRYSPSNIILKSEVIDKGNE